MLQLEFWYGAFLFYQFLCSSLQKTATQNATNKDYGDKRENISSLGSKIRHSSFISVVKTKVDKHSEIWKSC